MNALSGRAGLSSEIAESLIRGLTERLETEALRRNDVSLDEICVLKHYSSALPNGGNEWVHWKQVVPAEFDEFIRDIRSFENNGQVRMLAGVLPNSTARGRRSAASSSCATARTPFG